LACLDAAVQLLHVHGVVCPCTVVLEQCRWQQYDVIVTSWSSSEEVSIVRDITRMSCFVTTMKLPYAVQVYSTVFVKKCMRLHFSR